MIDRYEGQAPCPACFESSGFMPRWHPHTWEEPGWEDSDPSRPCKYCMGTGTIDADEAVYPEDIEEGTDCDGYLAALEKQFQAEEVLL